MSTPIDPIKSGVKITTKDTTPKNQKLERQAGEDSVVSNVQPDIKSIEEAELLTGSITSQGPKLEQAHGNLDEDIVKALLDEN